MEVEDKSRKQAKATGLRRLGVLLAGPLLPHDGAGLALLGEGRAEDGVGARLLRREGLPRLVHEPAELRGAQGRVLPLVLCLVLHHEEHERRQPVHVLRVALLRRHGCSAASAAVVAVVAAAAAAARSLDSRTDLSARSDLFVLLLLKLALRSPSVDVRRSWAAEDATAVLFAFWRESSA
jgi:hypothetical protein